MTKISLMQSLQNCKHSQCAPLEKKVPYLLRERWEWFGTSRSMPFYSRSNKGVGRYTTETHQSHSINIRQGWGEMIRDEIQQEWSVWREGTAEFSGGLSTTVLSPCHGFSNLHSAALVWWCNWESIVRCCILSICVSRWTETERLCSCENPCCICETNKYPKTGITSSGFKCAVSVHGTDRTWLWGVFYLLLEWQLTQFIDLSRYSSFAKVCRITAHVKRFIQDCRRKNEKMEMKIGPLEVQEIKQLRSKRGISSWHL